MKVLLQRVLSARVCVDNRTAAEIGDGLLLLVGFASGDDLSLLQQMAQKIVHLRIFPDADERLQYSLVDKNKQILAVPQFTLYASTSRGRRPDFTRAMHPTQARELFTAFVANLEELSGKAVECGVFGANMRVEIVNDGPFTLMLERSPSAK